jgi:hypothetical protein
MNIQQYYRSAANIALNGSLAAFIPVILILGLGVYFSLKLPLHMVILPFLLYSFICYQGYLIHHRRSLRAEIGQPSGQSILKKSNQLLIAFMPAPSLRMLLFEPGGHLVGEVRDMRFWWWRWFLPYFVDRLFPKTFGFYDHENKLAAIYQIRKRKKQIKMYDANGNEIGIFLKKNGLPRSANKRKGIVKSLVGDQEFFAEWSPLFPNMKIRNKQGMIVGKLIKGWMPLEWGKRFVDANTPILFFDESLEEREKKLLFGVLAYFFQYTNH